MLQEFIASNRDELIDRCRQKASARYAPSKAHAVMDHGVPLFLQQLVDTLAAEKAASAGDSQATAQPMPDIGHSAALHGIELLGLGFSIDQIVHEYGDVCQAVTGLAVEQGASISAAEFRTLNRCLDDAIADAVTSFGSARQATLVDRAESLHVSLSGFAEEHQRLLGVAIHACAAIKAGHVGSAGATGAVLDHTLVALRYLVERTLPDIRLASAMTTIVPN